MPQDVDDERGNRQTDTSGGAEVESGAPVDQDWAAHLSALDGPVAVDGGEAVDARHSQGMVYKPSGPVTQRFGDEVHGDKIVHIHQGIPEPTPEPLPQQPFEPQTLLVPGGPFLMGSVPAPGVPQHETPQHEVILPDYCIGRYPVTVDQYAAFIKDKRDQDAPRGWFNREPPPDCLDHPVTNVSWHDAVAYCDWLSGKTGRRYVLPSEAEWEKAASWAGGGEEGAAGVRKRRYPWGSEWLDGLCNAGQGGTTAVTAHAEGASAYGVEDLLGNVQEWTRSLWGSGTRTADFGYPYDPDDGREVRAVKDLPPQMRVVHRGGSCQSRAGQVSNTQRSHAVPASCIGWRGFRVAMEV